MYQPTAAALTVVRVERGAPRPPDTELRAALERDRVRLHLPQNNPLTDYAVAGPYAISVDGQDIDEYVVWER